MLFAYAISGETTFSAEAIHELRQAAEGLSQEHLACGLGFDWESLVPGTRVEGTFLRGYRQVASREEALEIAFCLRLLSRRFPLFTFYLSGGGDLPMTQLEAGEFQLFADTYERALAPIEVAITRAPGRVQA